MNEAETRAELIDPALRSAGWGVAAGSRIRREVIAPGRLVGNGRRAQPEFADYVLVYRGEKLAVIEAKKRSLPDTEGVGQAKKYAEKLEARFAYSTNGDGIYQIDMRTGEEGYISHYPSPDQLWDATFSTANQWRDRFADVPFETRSGTWEARYYQHNAIKHVLEAIVEGRDRILLTMATGTGKTLVAFQLTWKLFQSRWNLSRQPTRRPRILFLADRNILANQAYNAFSAFPDDALVRIDPEVIKKRGRVPKNGSVFFTIFQTFMAGRDDAGNPVPNFGDYPSNFFDFIIIDECHRGGASDESNWRGILEYFSPAVQLGLTATPRRANNADTYAYFGDPVYTYALKDGINDGFLTPFKVRQIDTTLDEYIYSAEDELMEGAIDETRTYTEADFNRIIEIADRERYRVQLFMEAIDQNQKTLVFCASQPHALAVRDLINQMKISTEPNYCVRVTAADGKLGEQHLSTFQDNEKSIPTILTTSQKLSTGVDARNVRNIVLMRPINTMIEFKKIIGRGTRLFDGKNYFTIYDFVQAYEHFNDPEWDGEPQEPVRVTSRRVREPADEHNTPITPDNQSNEGNEDPAAHRRPEIIKIKLADGKERTLRHRMSTSFWSPDGKPMTAAEFVERLFGQIPELFRDEIELRELWSRPDTRKALLEGLAEKGYGDEQLTEISRLIDAEKSDLYDVLTYIAYASEPISRRERVMSHKALIFSRYFGKQQEFLDFVLDQYIKEGVRELDQDKLPQLLELKYHDLRDAVVDLGNVSDIRRVFIGFQEYLYSQEGAA
ncbi:type I restriction endonuclease subunit R [Coleofasciculus sp. FACHB-542]|uniref:EcoAI/FtnUII family type I restriction enzme subunit R n=1 Tax=Coleofasciculus sp. FACHB-542 TaxID=2692787 RepID=UPI0016874098|nr:type I restriction endonuclease subunit R [Coleofasciculus sp. FACHB-542]MBD2087893.1 DEAD/DEAH box helicase family protein [Coleofasciculus sp. FACHB-542]